MVALWNKADNFHAVVCSSLFFFFSSSNLSRRRLDVCHTSTHGVALVQIYDAGLKDAKIVTNSPSAHHLTTLPGYMLATKAHVDNRKNLLSINISSRCSHNMVNFGPLAAEIGPVVWGTPANFNGFRVLAALLHGI